MNTPNQNLAPLGIKIVGFWTRKKLDILALLLKAIAWLCFYIGHFLKWLTMRSVGRSMKAKTEERIKRISRKTDKRELREAKFKLWFRSKFQHSFPWGKEDYRRILAITHQERRRMLKSLASPLCPKCYSTGNLGFNENTESFIVCRCVKQNLINMKGKKK